MKICILVVILFANYVSFAQCLSKIELDKAINQTSSLKDDIAINKLLLYQKQWLNCHYPQDSTYAKTFHLIGRRYRFIGLDTESEIAFQKALEYTQRAILINLQKRNDISEANLTNSYLNVGLLLSRKSSKRIEESKNFLIKAIEIGQKYSHKIEFASLSANQLTRIYIYSGDYEKAIQTAKLTKLLASKIKDLELISSALETWSEALRNLGKYDEAEKNLLEVIRINDKPKTNDGIIYLGNTYASLAVIANERKDFKKMTFYFEKSFKTHKQANFDYGMAMVKNNWGYLISERGNDIEAIKIYNEGLTYAKDSSLKVRILDNIGSVLLRKKDFKNSITTFHEAISTFQPKFTTKDIKNNPSPENIRNTLNKGYLLDLIANKAKGWLQWGSAIPNKSHLQNALNTYKTADRMIDIMRWEQTGEQSKLFWRKKTRSIYQNAIETCYLLNKPEEAFYFFEKSRAVMLNDRLKELGAKQLLSPEDQTQESKLQQEVDNARKLVSENKTNNEENQQKLLNSENAQTAFFKQIELKNPTYYKYKYDTSAVNIKDLQQKLKDQTLVEYFVADSVVYAFVVSSTGMKLHQIKASSYGSISNEILSMMADENALNKQFARYLGLSNQFYTQFVEPLSLPKGRVIVSPDGTIVPFSALSFSASQTQYLVKDYAFGYTYSAKFLNQEKKSIAPNAFLGIAPVQFKNNQLKLTDSDLSLQRISEHFSSPQLLLKDKATRKTFLETMGKYQVVQLYTHALANDTTAQLYLSDSIIKASELTTKELLPTELVVLSACQTGIGKDAKGEGVFSLSRSFAMLGIPSTLTTLWKVDNQATYQITELFYQYLDEGLSKDLALQKAQNEYLSQNTSGLTMPNFWAGYVLVGDNSPLEKSNQLIFWILGGLLLGSIGFYFKQKSPQKRAFQKF